MNRIKNRLRTGLPVNWAKSMQVLIFSRVVRRAYDVNISHF